MAAERISDRLVSWASDLEPNTRLQAERTAWLPIVAGHVALMPDAHLGLGATVGSVVPTDGAIMPACVGVDIGCGMAAVRTDLSAEGPPGQPRPRARRDRARHPRRRRGQGHRGADRSASEWLRAHQPRTSCCTSSGAAPSNRPARSEWQPLRRGLSRRGRHGMAGAALGESGHRQPAGPVAHRRGEGGRQAAPSGAGGSRPRLPARGHAGVRSLRRRPVVGAGLRTPEP